MNWLINILLNRGNDLSTYFFPNAYFFKRSFLALHQVPLWNPIQLGGIPYLADPQNYLFYLPNYLLLLLPIETAFLVLIFGHLLWGGIGIYKLGKQYFHLSSLLSTFCSLLFALCPMQISHLEAGHYSMLVAFSWLPWFLFVALKFIEKPNLKHCSLLSVLCFLLYINYINIAYYGLLFFGSYTVFYFFTHHRSFPIKKYIIHNMLYIILFLGLISPNLLAQLEFAPRSTRNLITFADAAQPVWSLSLLAKNLLFPFSLSHSQLATERVIYPGTIAWILALLGWWKSEKKSLSNRYSIRSFLAGWIGFSLLFSLGSRTPLFGILYTYFPLMKWMRIPTRIWIFSVIFLVLYAGQGMQYLAMKIKPQFRLFICLFVGLSVLLDLGFIDYKIFSKPTLKDQLSANFYAIITQDNDKPFRVYCTTGCWSLQKLGALGIPTIGGNNPIQSQDIVTQLEQAAGYTYSKYIPALPSYEVFSQKPQPNAELMGNLGVKYIASSYALTDSHLRLVDDENSFYLYLNSLSKPVSTFAYTSNTLTISLAIFGITSLLMIFLNFKNLYLFRI